MMFLAFQATVSVLEGFKLPLTQDPGTPHGDLEALPGSSTSPRGSKGKQRGRGLLQAKGAAAC